MFKDNLSKKKLSSQKESKKTQERRDTMRSFLLKKSQLPVIILIEGAELVELIDQEKKEEEEVESETYKMSLKKINMLIKENK